MITLQGILLAFLWSFGASAFFAFSSNMAKYQVVFGGILGAVGWTLYTVFTALGTQGEAYFIGAFSVALVSEVLAFFLKNPATVFLIPGIIPIVPGGGIFNMMRYAVQGNLSDALKTGYDTLIAAGAIALGVALASSLSKIFSVASKKISKGKVKK